MFVPTQLHVTPAKELSKAVAAELAEKHDEDEERRLKALVDKKLEEVKKNDFEDKLSQTKAS